MTPNCHLCGQDAVYVDNGPRLQYHYCRSCKVETQALEAVDSPVGFYSSNVKYSLPQEYLDLFINSDFISIKPPGETL